MTQDDIALMARESGLPSKGMTADGNEVSMARMTRFAELVAAKERLSCWNEINAAIKEGPLQGNGCDESSQRNGLILASNIVSNGMRSNNQANSVAEGDPVSGTNESLAER